MTPPPFGNFPKKHPYLGRRSSLSKAAATLRCYTSICDGIINALFRNIPLGYVCCTQPNSQIPKYLANLAIWLKKHPVYFIEIWRSMFPVLVSTLIHSQISSAQTADFFQMKVKVERQIRKSNAFKADNF